MTDSSFPRHVVVTGRRRAGARRGAAFSRAGRRVALVDHRHLASPFPGWTTRSTCCWKRM